MTSTLASVVEEIEAPVSEEQRETARAIADQVAQGAVQVVLRLPDGEEHQLTADELRLLLAVASARGRGQRVSVVGHDVMLSPQQAAELLGVSRPMVYRFIERGDLEATRVGTHWRLLAADVLALAQRRAGLLESVDAGFERIAQVMADQPQQRGHAGDAKKSWSVAREKERAASLERVRRRAKDRDE